MNIEAGDRIEAIFGQLERLDQLRAKELVTVAEFEEARGLLSAELLANVRPTSRAKEIGLLEGQYDRVGTLPFGDLHDHIVDDIAKHRIDDSAGLKQGAIAAIAQMAEGRVLNSGDSPELVNLVDVAFAPELWPMDPILPDPSGLAPQLLLQEVASLTEVSSRLRTRAGASPAAIAIADTAQHSALRASQKVLAQGPIALTGQTLKSAWRKLVLSDVSGALQGGAAAAAIAPAFGALAPIALPLAAAFGVVIGAGVQSGLAYGELP